LKKQLQFEDLRFDDFRMRARDPSLSRHEKVGFPNDYREGKEDCIFDDVFRKVKNLKENNKTILEIGPGCSQIPIKLAEICRQNDNKLIYVDSKEMLDHLPDAPHIHKYYGAFPGALGNDMSTLAGKIDAIIAYSVIQYVFVEGNLWAFIDHCLDLISDGGEVFFGDIPNISMRNRFFSSNSGWVSHRKFTGTDERPYVNVNKASLGKMDDSVILSILSRARSQGFHAWVLPQTDALPMANRREDILILKS